MRTYIGKDTTTEVIIRTREPVVIESGLRVTVEITEDTKSGDVDVRILNAGETGPDVFRVTIPRSAKLPVVSLRYPHQAPVVLVNDTAIDVYRAEETAKVETALEATR